VFSIAAYKISVAYNSEGDLLVSVDNVKGFYRQAGTTTFLNT